MKFYKQNDVRWALKKLNHSPYRFYRYGCFVTSLANLANLRPDEANERLTKAGLINKNGLILNSVRVAQVLGLADYDGLLVCVGKNADHLRPKYDTIAEVDYNRILGGVQQHFIIVLKDGRIFCPLKGLIKNPYRIISYRLYKAKENQMKDYKVQYKNLLARFRRLEKRYKFVSKLFNKFAETVRRAIKKVNDGMKDVPPF